MATDLFDRVAVIDVDTHLTEPPDVWTARVPASMHEQVPHVERIDGNDVWMAGGERLGHPGYYSMAGWDGVMPVSIPKTFDDIPAAMYDADARLRVPRRAGHPRPGALPERRWLRERLLPAPRRPRAGRAVRARVQRLPARLVQRGSRPPARGHRAAVLGRRPRHRRAAPRHRARPPRGELLQPAAGLRPAAARAQALGPGVGCGAGGRRLGQLPRRAAARWARSSATRPRWGG